jgi:signal transduction histidine kinase
VVVAVAALAVTAIGAVDYATGPLWSMSVFYLVPAAWVTSLCGRRAGAAVAALSCVSGILCDVVLQPHYRHRAIAAWNVALMVMTVLVVVELVDRSRRRALAAMEADRRGREFLSFAAHQLRTPLAGIRASVDALMLDSDGDPVREQLLAGLGTETLRAGRLMGSLLRVARLDQHEALPMRTVDLVALVRAEVDRAARARPGVAFSTGRGQADGPWIECNPEAVGEALANLLDNAGRHAQTEVVIAVRTAEDLVEIDVRDDGPGLSPGPAAAAFERFVSLDGQGGSGLGLPIARGIAEAHRGSLAYERGSFVVRLPGPRRMPPRSGEESRAAAHAPESSDRAREVAHPAPRRSGSDGTA